ncbi:hypothetical protein JOD64_001825 [Micromonospora luteifusca]|uniref:Uncharacterized protein n=1 Tax=Micromonospora luteifusca TaxID=709860 RepID=A0ABS2LQY3_9ACTN|nr:hypothetical protein [Micromonospora luteifusca]MBM7490603.1 hypothetical protein [Micromonospora luteifusca]
MVALDPTMLLQEPGHFGGALLDWLEKDLRWVRKNTPIVIFQHHPVGDAWYGRKHWRAAIGGFAAGRLQERGATLLVDAVSGATRWQAQLGFPVFNSGAVVDGDAAWGLGVNSQFGALDLNTGRLDRLVKLGTGYSFSTPVLVGGQLVAADQNGRVRGVDLA